MRRLIINSIHNGACRNVPLIFILFIFCSFIQCKHSNKHEIANGMFVPSWESFEQNYKCPQWFRDAKFGIWAHWSAQCVPALQVSLPINKPCEHAIVLKVIGNFSFSR